MAYGNRFGFVITDLMEAKGTEDKDLVHGNGITVNPTGVGFDLKKSALFRIQGRAELDGFRAFLENIRALSPTHDDGSLQIDSKHGHMCFQKQH